MSKNDEFCIYIEELCIKNEELCIKNDEFCSCDYAPDALGSVFNGRILISY